MAALRGGPDDVAAVADTLAFDHKYTSDVIAWAPEDQPSDQDIDRVLDEFEQSAWAGLAPPGARRVVRAAPALVEVAGLDQHRPALRKAGRVSSPAFRIGLAAVSSGWRSQGCSGSGWRPSASGAAGWTAQGAGRSSSSSATWSERCARSMTDLAAADLRGHAVTGDPRSRSSLLPSQSWLIVGAPAAYAGAGRVDRWTPAREAE